MTEWLNNKDRDIQMDSGLCIFKKYLFIYLAVLGLSCCMGGLSFLTRDRTWAAYLGSMSLSHWTTGDCAFSEALLSGVTIFLPWMMPFLPTQVHREPRGHIVKDPRLHWEQGGGRPSPREPVTVRDAPLIPPVMKLWLWLLCQLDAGPPSPQYLLAVFLEAGLLAPFL